MHCVVVPLAFAFVPALGFSLYSHHHPAHDLAIALLHLARWEAVFAWAASALAGSSAVVGYARHREPAPLLAALAGSILLVVATSLPAVAQDRWWHALLAVAGGATLAAAHLLNLRASRHPPVQERAIAVP